MSATTEDSGGYVEGFHGNGFIRYSMLVASKTISVLMTKNTFQCFYYIIAMDCNDLNINNHHID